MESFIFKYFLLNNVIQLKTNVNHMLHLKFLLVDFHISIISKIKKI